MSAAGSAADDWLPEACLEACGVLKARKTDGQVDFRKGLKAAMADICRPLDV